MQTVTETYRDYIRHAQSKGQRLHRDGAVEVIGGTVALVEDGMLRVLDGERAGRPCLRPHVGRAIRPRHDGRWRSQGRQRDGGVGRPRVRRETMMTENNDERKAEGLADVGGTREGGEMAADSLLRKGEIDWMVTPLRDFFIQHEMRDGLTTGRLIFPLGEGAAQDLVYGLFSQVETTYAELLPEVGEGLKLFEEEGKVPLLRDGVSVVEYLDRLTLGDLPAILDTFVVLEEGRKAEEREEKERKAEERKRINRLRARERKRLKELGEW